MTLNTNGLKRVASIFPGGIASKLRKKSYCIFYSSSSSSINLIQFECFFEKPIASY